MDLISVIVPIYNVEKYLNKCIESIVSQTYTNLELILVDDGSTDGSPAICDQWSAMDKRIVTFHRENHGVSAARNFGKAKATGAYLCYIDSDDIIDPLFVEFLHSAIKKNDSQIAACDILFFENESDIRFFDKNVDITFFDTTSPFDDIQHNKGYRVTPCNKLYSMKFIENELFPEDKKHEDEFFANSIFSKCESSIYIDAQLYYYRQHSQSWMHSQSLGHLDTLDAFYERIVLFEKNYPDLLLNAKIIFCKSCINLYSLYSDDKNDKKIAFNRIRLLRKKVRFSSKELLKLSKKDLLYAFFSSPFFISPFTSLRKLRSSNNGNNT